MIKYLIIGALLTHTYRLEKDLTRLVEKHNELIELLDESNRGASYAASVALAAFKRLPVDQMQQMQTDVDFLHIVAGEK